MCIVKGRFCLLWPFVDKPGKEDANACICWAKIWLGILPLGHGKHTELLPTHIVRCATLEAIAHRKGRLFLSMTLCRQGWQEKCQCLHLRSQNSDQIKPKPLLGSSHSQLAHIPSHATGTSRPSMPLSPTRIMHCATLEANVHSKRKVLPSMTLCRQAWQGGCQCLHMLGQNLTRNFATGARQTHGTASNPHSAPCYTGSKCVKGRFSLLWPFIGKPGKEDANACICWAKI